MILALETSCDDTCAAVLTPDGVIASNVISSQHVHDRFGGVVPEVAARHHLDLMDAVVDQALQAAGVTLDDITTVAATQGPGLVGALLVGLNTAKAIAAARELPFVAVDHLQGHVAANFIAPEPFAPPFVCLIASGGHSLLVLVTEYDGFEVLGSTRDDAAGEAFDKGARLLGLGFPGGPAMQRLAQTGDPEAFAFPTAKQLPGLEFSFSGVKTALLYAVRDLGEEQAQARAADLAASFQAAIVRALIDRCARALEQTGCSRLALGGGVAANGPLRAAATALGVEVHIPALALCPDNAAMIASAARFAPALAYPDYLPLDAYASGERALA